MAHDDFIPSDNFRHDYTDEIVCPYCGYEYGHHFVFVDKEKCDKAKLDFYRKPSNIVAWKQII